MDIHSIRQQLRTKTIYEIPLRVTYYARDSSESDEQLNSLDNQITYYENLIRQNKSWTFVPGYIDEGLSGISTRKRENFKRMVWDASENKFDLIITKEISRFARNTLDSIQNTRQLLSYGVGVFFQNDNINTLDEDSELRLSIMSSIAQDELRKLSSRVKFGHQQAIKSKVVLGNSRIFGYQKDNRRLVIDEEQAVMVRELFQLYASDSYSMKQLEKLFWEKGYRNSKGKRIAHTTMSGIISNPKYKGYYVGNKVKVIDMFTKKQKFLPPDEWVMFKDETGEIVPAIVDEELWEQANAVLRRRSEDVKNRQGICNHANLLTGKLLCTHCGRAFYRKESRDRQGHVNSKWVCSGKINNGTASCPTFALYEEELKPLIFAVFSETEVNVEDLMEEYAQRYRALDRGGELDKEIEACRSRIELIQKKKSKLLEYNITGQISDRDFLTMNRQCEQECNAAQEQLQELEEQQLSKDEFRQHMDHIRSVLRQARKDAESGIVTKEFVAQYIDRIYVTMEEDGSARLDIKIFTGETTQKYLEKLKKRGKTGQNSEGCTGHTFKEKTEERLVTGIQCSPASAVAEMETTKRLWRKTSGRQYDHYIQSFAPGEPVAPAVAHRIAVLWAEHQFPGYECVVATHVDRDHVHSHVIVNSVGFETGRKLHTSAHWLQEAKDYSDRLCERNGLSICQKGKTYDGQQREDATSWSKEQYQLLEKASRGETKSFLVEIAVAIATVLKVAVSREDFIQKLLDLGVSTTWTDKRKYITFSDLEGNKVRNAKLEKIFHVDFSKEALTHEFESRSREAHRSASPSNPRSDKQSEERSGAQSAQPQQRQEDAPLSLAQRLEEASQELERRNRLQGCPSPRQPGRGSAVRSHAQPVSGQQRQDECSLSLAQRLEDARRALEGRDHPQQPAQRKRRQDLDR